MEVTGHRLRVIRSFTVRKVAGEYKNEDFAALSDRKGIYALSDGASISFDSASWARIAAVNFVRAPQVTRDWMAEAIGSFVKLYDRDALAWMAQAAFDRGSFASLLGIQLHDLNSLEVFAIGDSEAFLCDDVSIVAMFPYSLSTQFSDSPLLLSTDPSKNSFLVEENYPMTRTVYWDLTNMTAPAVYCMTDALAQWVLQQKEEGNQPIRLLQSIRRARQFENFVNKERASGRMKRDDTTLFVLA